MCEKDFQNQSCLVKTEISNRSGKIVQQSCPCLFISFDMVFQVTMKVSTSLQYNLDSSIFITDEGERWKSRRFIEELNSGKWRLHGVDDFVQSRVQL
jgi:hypothetical protein